MYIAVEAKSSWFLRIMKFIGIACLLGAILLSTACANQGRAPGTANDKLSGLNDATKSSITQEWGRIERLINRRAPRIVVFDY